MSWIRGLMGYVVFNIGMISLFAILLYGLVGSSTLTILTGLMPDIATIRDVFNLCVVQSIIGIILSVLAMGWGYRQIRENESKLSDLAQVFVGVLIGFGLIIVVPLLIATFPPLVFQILICASFPATIALVLLEEGLHVPIIKKIPVVGGILFSVVNTIEKSLNYVGNHLPDVIK